MIQQPTSTLLAWRASFEEGAKAAAARRPSHGPSKAAGALGGILSDLYSNAEAEGGNLAISRGSKEGTIWRFHGQAGISADCKTAAVHANVLSSSDVFYAARPEETATSPPQPQSTRTAAHFLRPIESPFLNVGMSAEQLLS